MGNFRSEILMDLPEGALFLWRHRPSEVYKIIKQPEDSNGKALVRCVMYQAVGGHWLFATRHCDEDWNPLAAVDQVDVTINVEIRPTSTAMRNLVLPAPPQPTTIAKRRGRRKSNPKSVKPYKTDENWKD